MIKAECYKVIQEQMGYGQCYISASTIDVGFKDQYLRKDGTTDSSLRGRQDWFNTVEEANTFLSEWKVKQAHE